MTHYSNHFIERDNCQRELFVCGEGKGVYYSNQLQRTILCYDQTRLKKYYLGCPCHADCIDGCKDCQHWACTDPCMDLDANVQLDKVNLRPSRSTLFFDVFISPWTICGHFLYHLFQCKNKAEGNYLQCGIDCGTDFDCIGGCVRTYEAEMNGCPCWDRCPSKKHTANLTQKTYNCKLIVLLVDGCPCTFCDNCWDCDQLANKNPTILVVNNYDGNKPVLLDVSGKVIDSLFLILI